MKADTDIDILHSADIGDSSLFSVVRVSLNSVYLLLVFTSALFHLESFNLTVIVIKDMRKMISFLLN